MRGAFLLIIKLTLYRNKRIAENIKVLRFAFPKQPTIKIGENSYEKVLVSNHYAGDRGLLHHISFRGEVR